MNTKELWNKAEAFMQRGDLASAHPIYLQICQLDAQDAEAALMLAAISGELGQVDSAIASAQRAISIDPEYAEAHHVLARLFSHAGQTTAARDALLKAVEHDPEFAEAWVMLAGIQGALGDVTGAAESGHRAVNLAPDNLAARINLANALSSLGKTREAIEQCTIILDSDASVPSIWASLASLRLQEGSPDIAREAIDRALQLEPDNDWAQSVLGQVLVAQGHDTEAISVLEKVLTTDPGHEQIWAALSSAYARTGNFSGLEAFCQQVLTTHPDCSPAMFNLGYALEHQQARQEALECYRRVTELEPDMPIAWVRHGMLAFKLDYRADATHSFERAMELGADSAPAHFGRAVTLRVNGCAAESEKHCRLALELVPDDPDTLNLLGRALTDQGRYDEALDIFDHVLQLDPGNHDAITGCAETFERMGQCDKAYELLDPVLNGMDTYADAACVLAKISPHIGKQEEAAELIERLLGADRDMPDSDLMSLHFRAGDVYDQLGDPDRAFAHYRSGNDLKRQSMDMELYTRYIDMVISRIDRDFLESRTVDIPGSSRLVFIVGMPRSGTSLIEQIIATHPDAHGCGELEQLNNFAYSLGLDQLRPDSVAEFCDNLDPARLIACAERYYQVIGADMRDAHVITDKMPSNFRWLGLLQLLFPEARVIHARRHPLDTCLSCYFKDFSGVHEYAYRLDNLAGYYREYLRLMHHWKSMLSIPVLDVDYESLVGETESQSRRILDFCGLGWTDEVLQFHQSDRNVITASYDQVRQPVYSSSINRWKPYAKHLGPLLSGFPEEALPDTDA